MAWQILKITVAAAVSLCIRALVELIYYLLFIVLADNTVGWIVEFMELDLLQSAAVSIALIYMAVRIMASLESSARFRAEQGQGQASGTGGQAGFLIGFVLVLSAAQFIKFAVQLAKLILRIIWSNPWVGMQDCLRAEDASDDFDEALSCMLGGDLRDAMSYLSSIYTAARGNPNTDSHIYFLINKFILQMHAMNFWKYHHQYFTDSSCDFIPTHMPQGI